MSKYDETPTWRPSYADPIGSLLKSIPEYYKRVKNFIDNPNNESYVTGFSKCYRLLYLAECNRGKNATSRTLKETEETLEGKYGTKNSKKVQNLLKAIEYLFGDSLLEKNKELDFSPDQASRLNFIIGEGIFEECGTYRKKYAQPAGYNYFYLAPHLIEKHFYDLFNDINRVKVTSENWYEIASKFLIKFLYIHPYVNGNGRTARLLVSMLLMKYSLVPIPLFTLSYNRYESNRIYLNCIIEADRYNNYLPLNSLIIESTYNTLFNFIKSLNIEDE